MRSVAQAQLLAGHLVVVLLERLEVLVAARLVDLDRVDLEGVAHLLGQPHEAGDMPDAPVRVAVGVRHRHDDVASPARIVMKKLGKSTQPWLSVIWASVSPLTSKPMPVRVSRVACCSRVRAVTPSGKCNGPSSAR